MSDDTIRDLCRIEPVDGNGVPYCTSRCSAFSRAYGDPSCGPWCRETAMHTLDPDEAEARIVCYAWALGAASVLRELNR